MNEILTIEQINQRFPDEWVLIGDPETDETLEVFGGKVLYHGKSREKVYQTAKDLPSPKHFTTHFTGELLDPDVAYIL